jgi:hypothetical protein
MIKILLKYLQHGQCCILGILVVTLSLNNIKIKHWFLLVGVPQCVASPIAPFHDFI